MTNHIIFSNNVESHIDGLTEKLNPSSVFVHVDTNTAKFVLPILSSQSKTVKNAKIIVTPCGDINKTIDNATIIWKHLSEESASRTSLLINLGGGVVSDMGTFAASTFKRGIKVLNIPTTLLGAVDASVGGKTGVNFNGLKNHIGTFYEPYATIISTEFFQTLPLYEKLSGYAEMIKHAMIKGETAFNQTMDYNISVPPVNPDALLELIKESVLVKLDIVNRDPTEQNIRKVLNYGHTVAHALETFAAKKRENPISHGFAVAQGLVIETILSHLIENLDTKYVNRLAPYVKSVYTPYYFTCDDYPALIEYMRQDKKNNDYKSITFTLLKNIGEPVTDVIVEEKEICAAFDIYRDMMGI